MKYVSTRGKSPAVLFSEAIQNGLAPDGGLYVPEIYPTWAQNRFSTLNLAKLGQQIFQPWLEGDPLQRNLTEICQSAFHFPALLEFLNPSTAILELFHGPTAAFKDFGAQFLAGCIAHMPQLQPGIVLVATSGDTGGAVASAFFQKPGIQVVILYPKGKISALQELQLNTWGENVTAIAVRGTFDDCQKLVKTSITENLGRNLAQNPASPKHLLSANSINLGRLLPQTCYYATSSLNYFQKTGIQPGYIIPTGNLGNAVAALWTKKMGFPIREVVLATNSNSTLRRYFQSGQWSPEPSIQTLANAMDVGNPNNIERLNHLYPDFKDLCKDVHVISVSDEQITQTIQESAKQENRIYCPHTATAVFAAAQIQALRPSHWIIVSTAHPAKFNDVIEPRLGYSVPLPPNLSFLLSKKPHPHEIEANADSLTNYLNFSRLSPKRQGET